MPRSFYPLDNKKSIPYTIHIHINMNNTNTIPAGETRPLPNKRSLLFTPMTNQYSLNRTFYQALNKAYDEQPDIDTKGGNDKYFFSFSFIADDTQEEVKIWAVANEINGLTIMFPEEY